MTFKKNLAAVVSLVCLCCVSAVAVVFLLLPFCCRAAVTKLASAYD